MSKNCSITQFTARHKSILICSVLVIMTFSVYWQVMDHEFLHFDDDIYVKENLHVRQGITLRNSFWAFTATRATNWHPLTWFSHMLDCQLFGVNSGLHHLTNLLFHIANTLLLFFILSRMTGAVWRSAFAAALFALHPVNVESVAWIAERKNLLSTFFWMLTMLSYSYYAVRPGVLRYLLTIILFTLGLLAKPMLVTLPFVFLLMDYWPLGRIRFTQARKEEHPVLGTPYAPASLARLVLEKVPLFILSAGSIAISFISLDQKTRAATQFSPLSLRLANAVVSYVQYIGKMFWPVDLAIYYPFPTTMFPLWQIAGALLLLLVITAFVLYQWRRNPYLPTGWFWYLGTLFPVIGLVQGGLWPALADRWAYVPFIGLFIMIAWGIPDLIAQWRYKKAVLATLALAIIMALTSITYFQLGYWKDSITIFRHTLNVTVNNFIAHTNLGFAFEQKEMTDEAFFHFSEALMIKPDKASVQTNMGNILRKQGKADDSVRYYNEALRIDPDFYPAHIGLGNLFKTQKRIRYAIYHYNEALRIDPENAVAHFNLGNVLFDQGDIDGAVIHYSEVVRTEPYNADAHFNLGNALYNQGRVNEAIRHCKEALRIDPDNVEGHFGLGNVLRDRGNLDEAAIHYNEVLRIQPGFIQALNNLSLVYMKQGDYESALSSLERILEMNPDSVAAHYNMACLYAKQEMKEEALTWLRKAVGLGFNDWELLRTDSDLINIRETPGYQELLMRKKK